LVTEVPTAALLIEVPTAALLIELTTVPVLAIVLLLSLLVEELTAVFLEALPLFMLTTPLLHVSAFERARFILSLSDLHVPKDLKS
jgi:hypothetical protein